MPILVKDYTWTQTSKVVNIRVPLNPGFHDKVDLFPTDTFIKANFNPFLLEIFLLHEVDIKKSRCIVKDDMIVLDLTKREDIEWQTLEKELTKQEKMKLKQEISEKCVEEATQAKEDKRIKKSHMDRFAVQRAMDIDNKQHDLMESRRAAETKKAMDNLEEWRTTKQIDTHPPLHKLQEFNSNDKIIELPPSPDDSASADSSSETEDKPQTVNKKPKAKTTSVARKKMPSPTSDIPLYTPVKSEYVEKKKVVFAKRVLPRLRNAGSVEVTHTPRTFPTPSRESTAQEEEAWLKNITAARRATGFISEDLRPEEHDPQWCKEKGDEFFRCGNFLGAISAYTHGITLSDKLPSLYSNRAAVHFALGNFNKCMNDCQTALDLMKPACEGNRRSRAKCIARRAAALARVGLLDKAINEMKAASKLLPEDEAIKKDIYDMERAWEQNPDSD